MKKITPKNMEKLAIEIIEFLHEQTMWSATSIYANKQKFSTESKSSDKQCTTSNGAIYYVTTDVDVTQHIEYNNPKTITMTFEGPLYDVMNYSYGSTYDNLEKLFAKYGLYMELGYAWSLAAYEI